MSISLNDHENRITELEKKSYSLTLEPVNNGEWIFVNRTWKNLIALNDTDSYVIQTDGGLGSLDYPPYPVYGATGGVISKSFLTMFQHGEMGVSIMNGAASSEYVLIRYYNGYLQGYSSQDNANPTDNKIRLFLLKIYYIFRYNIKRILKTIPLKKEVKVI